MKNLKEHGVEVKGKKVLVLGAGGAATAIQVQLALEGTEEIQIFNRQEEKTGRKSPPMQGSGKPVGG